MNVDRFKKDVAARNGDSRVTVGYADAEGTDAVVVVHAWTLVARFAGPMTPAALGEFVAAGPTLWLGPHERESARRVVHAVTGLQPDAACEVTRQTAPDVELRARGLAGLIGAEAACKNEVERRERALASCKRGFGRTDARRDLTAAREKHRKAQRELRHEDSALCHAIRVGEAAFDLRVLRAVMRLVGVKRLEVVPSGPLDPALALFSGGCGLVMPFRT